MLVYFLKEFSLGKKITELYFGNVNNRERGCYCLGRRLKTPNRLKIAL